MSDMTDIVLPEEQLEGTEAAFSTWLVAVGDQVNQGQPIAELETDKVAIEICAEQSGTIKSLIAKAGDKVVPNTSLGTLVIGSNPVPKGEANHTATHDADQVNSQREEKIETSGVDSISPAVRRLIKENDVDISQVAGTGKRGRVTRDDVKAYLANNSANSVAKRTKNSHQNSTKNSSSPFDPNLPQTRALQGTKQPHSTMRKSIASHMVTSLLETSPHVTSVFEMDMGNIIEHRKWHKKEYETYGVKLTFTAYFLSAMAEAVAKVPQVNSRFHEDALELFSDVNIGVGTALGDAGLVVPVVQQVQSLNLFQIAKALTLQTEKARNGKLTPSDMKNGTLTISNHGVSGSLFATPIIINQPQVAILGVGKLEKRVVVEQQNGEDVMVIRPKCYVSLSIDHRALDAHQTNLFLSEFVDVIENWGI